MKKWRDCGVSFIVVVADRVVNQPSVDVLNGKDSSC